MRIQMNKYEVNIWKTKVTFNITFEKLLNKLKEKTFEDEITKLNSEARGGEITIFCKDNMVYINYDFLDFLSFIGAKLIDRIFVINEQQFYVIIKTKNNKKYQIPSKFLGEDEEYIDFNLEMIKEMEENI